MPEENFKQAIEKEMTGRRETEPWEIVYFKLNQSKMPVIEKAILPAEPANPTDPVSKSSGRRRRNELDHVVRGLS